MQSIITDDVIGSPTHVAHITPRGNNGAHIPLALVNDHEEDEEKELEQVQSMQLCDDNDENSVMSGKENEISYEINMNPQMLKSENNDTKHEKRLTLENLEKFDRENNINQLVNLQKKISLEVLDNNVNNIHCQTSEDLHINGNMIKEKKDEDLEVFVDEKEKNNETLEIFENDPDCQKALQKEIDQVMAVIEERKEDTILRESTIDNEVTSTMAHLIPINIFTSDITLNRCSTIAVVDKHETDESNAFLCNSHILRNPEDTEENAQGEFV